MDFFSFLFYLQAAALVGQLANAIESHVNQLASDGVVAASVVVGSILLSGDELLRVVPESKRNIKPTLFQNNANVQLAVSAGANFVDDSGLEIDKDGTGHVLSRAGLREEGVERSVLAADRLVRGHGAFKVSEIF